MLLLVSNQLYTMLDCFAFPMHGCSNHFEWCKVLNFVSKYYTDGVILIDSSLWASYSYYCKYQYRRGGIENQECIICCWKDDAIWQWDTCSSWKHDNVMGFSPMCILVWCWCGCYSCHVGDPSDQINTVMCTGLNIVWNGIHHFLWHESSRWSTETLSQFYTFFNCSQLLVRKRSVWCWVVNRFPTSRNCHFIAIKIMSRYIRIVSILGV